MGPRLGVNRTLAGTNSGRDFKKKLASSSEECYDYLDDRFEANCRHFGLAWRDSRCSPSSDDPSNRPPTHIRTLWYWGFQSGRSHRPDNHCSGLRLQAESDCAPITMQRSGCSAVSGADFSTMQELAPAC